MIMIPELGGTWTDPSGRKFTNGTKPAAQPKGPAETMVGVQAVNLTFNG